MKILFIIFDNWKKNHILFGIKDNNQQLVFNLNFKEKYSNLIQDLFFYQYH